LKEPSKAEVEFEAALRSLGVEVDAKEYKFHPVRRWRFDFAWPDKKVAIEVEGGVYMRGRHVRPKGFIGDCEKYNMALLMGWKVLRAPVDGRDWSITAAANVKRLLRDTK